MRMGQFGRGVRLFALLAMTWVVTGFTTVASASDGDDASWVNNVFKQSASAQRGTRVASLGGGAVSGEGRSTARRGGRALAPEDRPQASNRAANARAASLNERSREPSRSRGSLSGGNVSWIASSGCLNGTLRSVVSSIASSFGSVTVNSTCRDAGHNRRVGGAPKSLHLSGDAVDFRVSGNVGGVYAALRNNGSVGGLKHYGGGLFHIDTGARRSW
jgi:Peptidase M15